ncbi:hypothetical protein H112_05210 [Trichophyton rubrum D6]|uniref:Major facilitator superfamily (MFS) profile domain-containing protein n=4 Tax=Trichophyton TaxID=5550 RepID=A0A178EP84_TRIRU|nr:uncharacterized protein TERG_02961 [Trichophyton rubrum CBS 118892]EZF20532.1 hypothetical protein H100_05232 [Trichophyton rubrum MR850]EZF40858.1 hypothetical protein H102_05222 [Trichophyton rubrum CBS 100081]EZF51744.1 hypothetical protein H103_05221 [Trichophyton rubrum CBS 288.86]EZF62152.1 hypothetical protein H104_05213 [Trichophyton rubrum CBS 289.86]EZF72990.1 hypothetical protein H105_05241 [Trichophyton soudanense CBS 452.61]EZF83400.1 hypothetical protein H110_05220 [Trichophy
MREATVSCSRTDTNVTLTGAAAVHGQANTISTVISTKKTWRFWAIFPALCMTTFLSALDTSILSTALPTISKDLGAGPLYIWITNAYVLSSTVTQPLFGQSANIFGRRWLLILSVVWFAIGSGLAAGANGTTVIILGRTIQGIGGGGINTLIDIVIGDLVPMRERGKYVALMGVIWAIGTVVGPVLGGGLTEHASWRWIFYMNLPLSGLSLILLYFFLRVASPPGNGFYKQLLRVDFIGNMILVMAVISILLPLTWAGTLYPWSSWKIILPLVIGFLGLILFYAHQTSRFCREPSIPLRLFPTPTSLFSLILGFTGSILIYWVGYFLPVYFQAVLGTSATKSGLFVLPITGAVAPFGILAGILISVWGKYRAFHFIGFGLMSIAVGLFSILDQHSSAGYWAGFQIIFGAGSGLIYSSTLPPIQASLHESDMATATATWAFMRGFGSIWGVAIPTAIFNEKTESLLGRISDPSLRRQLSNGGAYALASSGLSSSLMHDPKLLTEVIGLYTQSLRFVWLLAIPFGMCGFVASFPIRQLELKTHLETEFGLQEQRQEG